MKFRQHRGSLDAAMETCVDLQPTRKAISDHLNQFPLFALVPASIQVVKYGDGGPDHRIGWAATYVVKDSTGVLGFTDGPVEDG